MTLTDSELEAIVGGITEAVLRRIDQELVKHSTRIRALEQAIVGEATAKSTLQDRLRDAD